MPGRARTIWARAALEWRVLSHRPAEWILVSGHRLLVSTLLLIGVYAVLELAVVVGLTPLREETAMLFVLFALISGNFTLIAIVVSLSQFVLARHLETPGEIREKIDDMIRYRQEVGETAQQSVIPISHSQFFLTLFESVRRELRVIDRQRDPANGEEVQRMLDDVVAGLDPHVEYVIDILERPETGIRYALYVTLSADYETSLHIVWSIQAERLEDLSTPAANALDRLVETLEQIDIARRTFKSVFIQAELASLSRLLLLIGLPTLVVLLLVMLLFSAGIRPISSGGFIPTVFPVVVSAGLGPIVLLAAYIVRLATVARRTATLYPFSSRAD